LVIELAKGPAGPGIVSAILIEVALILASLYAAAEGADP
jgi:hypothetical protein